MLWEIENLTKDISTLSQMSNLVSTLHCSHLQLESSIRDMLSALNKQLADRQASDSQLSYLELILHTRLVFTVMTAPKKSCLIMSKALDFIIFSRNFPSWLVLWYF